MATKRKVIITCAVTGAIHTPTMSPHIPITPDQIIVEKVFLVGGGDGLELSPGSVHQDSLERADLAGDADEWHGAS